MMKTVRWLDNGIDGRHVLLALLVFFGVMLVANGALVYYAINTFSGGDRPDPYRSGLRYNETIAADTRQAALGWESLLAYDPASGRLTLWFADEAGQPVTGLALEATLSRPATDREDRPVAFQETEAGVYAADIAIPPGAWVISLATSDAGKGDPVYRLRRRLFVAERL